MSGETEDLKNIDVNENTKSPEKVGILLELGDIIQLDAPANTDIHEQTFIIVYIDSQKIKLTNVSSYEPHTLYIDSEGGLTDESIVQILLLNRSEHKGYSRQNGLVVKTWVDIHFGGEIPVIITGEITNLEEDMIEITIFPSMRVIYIDFKYEGIPENLPIEEINIRQKPAIIEKMGSMTNLESTCDETCEIPQQPDATIEYTETGESIITIPANAAPNENIRTVLHTMYIDANSIFEETEGEDVILNVEVPESQKRYSIDIQVNDLMDELLSTIPNTQRTKTVMDNIHQLIERFKELRNRFSKFDDNGNVVDIQFKGYDYKPLIERIKRFDSKIRWLIPVVQQYFKLYIDGIPKSNFNPENELLLAFKGEDVSISRIEESLSEQDSIAKSYYKNAIQGDVLKYNYMHSALTNLLTPFDPPLNPDFNLVTEKEVFENMDTVVNNLDNFYRTCVGDKTTRFVIQRYNLGLSKIDSKEIRQGKVVYVRKLFMPSDKINVKSFLFLPIPVMKFSQIDLPGTNILTKSQLSQNWLQTFRLLKKNTQIDHHVINDLDKEVNYKDDNSKKPDLLEENIEFLKQISEFSLDEDLHGIENKFEKYLNSVIPKTRILFRLIKNNITDKLSFVDVVKALEAFYVYPDDITYQQYNEIRYFIKEKIKEYRSNYEKNLQEFLKIQNFSYKINLPVNKVENMFSEKKEYLEQFETLYKTRADYSTTELLCEIMNVDSGLVFSQMLSKILISLVTPNKLLDGIGKPAVDDMGELEKIKPKDCVRRFLSKKYSSIKELQKENNSGEIYYDKEYDDTPYYILKKYEEKQKTMVPEMFVDYLAENLIQKHDCPPNMAKELASTLISGKKSVTQGEYAILELRPTLPSDIDKSKLTDKEKEEIEKEADVRTKTQYYRRVKDHWLHDNSISENAFIDTQSLFCNLDQSCFKNRENQQCEPIEMGKLMLKRKTNESILSEMDKRLSITVEEMEKDIDEKLLYYTKNLKNQLKLREVQLYKANYLAYELGKMHETFDMIECPYVKLRDLILSQDDFVKKQYDISKFVSEYCREPMVIELNEDQRWYYCKETNTKLLPIFLYELAETFLHGNDYQQKLDEIIRLYGVLSDDGDSIVDKHSGYVVRKIDFTSEEGYDESGFKITSNEIMKKDLGTIISEVLSKKVRVFDDETDQMIYNVFSSVCSNVGISTELIEDLVLRVSIELIRNKEVVLEEAVYVRKTEKLLKDKGKTSAPYPTYRNQSLIAIVTATTLVAIQCSTPSIKSRKTYPGCVRSFDGYPLSGGVEDTSGIKYLACVVNSMKAKQAPWDSILKLNSKTIEQRMMDVLDRYVMPRNDIRDLYVSKREYLILMPTDVSIQENQAISKWTDFLPPIVPLNLTKNLHNVSGDFKSSLLESMRKGHRDQHEYIHTLQNKIKQHTFGIIESVNAILSKKDLLMKTASKVPFLENACCNEEKRSTNPIAYFTNENPMIDNYIKSIRTNAQLLHDVKRLSKAAILYDSKFTGIVYPEIPVGHLDTNVYAALIHYCKYDRNMPVPEEFRAICGERPPEYNIRWTIEEKMEFLKKNGRRFSAADLENVMAIVEKRNVVHLNENIKVSELSALKDILTHMDVIDSNLVEYPLRKLLMEVIDTYVPKNMHNEKFQEMQEKRKEVYRLRKYLTKTNTQLLSEIYDFLNQFGKGVSDTNMNKVKDHLNNIGKWQSDRKITETGLYYDESLYVVINFIKNSAIQMSKIFPNFIMNKVEPREISKMWGKSLKLSDFHANDISRYISEYYVKLDKFKEDNTLNRFFVELQTRVIDLLSFMQNIPIETPVLKNGEIYYSLFDKQTTYMLYTYCWYSILHEFIQCANDPNMIQLDIQELKQDKRAVIRENKNPSNFLQTGLENVGETDMNRRVEMEIAKFNIRDFKERVCLLLYTFLEIDQTNKKTIDRSYPDISKKVQRTKEEEKKTITDSLGNMEKDVRQVEVMLKNYKLGRWNLGTQKGIFMYDKDTYDQNREMGISKLQQEQTDIEDTTFGELVQNNEIGYEIEDLEEDENADVDDFYENEANDISQFGVDYMDEGYYGEQNDDDFSDDS